VAGDSGGLCRLLQMIGSALLMCQRIVALRGGGCDARQSRGFWGRRAGGPAAASFGAYASCRLGPMNPLAALGTGGCDPRDHESWFCGLIGWLVFGERMDRGKCWQRALICRGGDNRGSRRAGISLLCDASKHQVDRW